MADISWVIVEPLGYCVSAVCGLKFIVALFLAWVEERNGRRFSVTMGKMGDIQIDIVGAVSQNRIEQVIASIHRLSRTPESCQRFPSSTASDDRRDPFR